MSARTKPSRSPLLGVLPPEIELDTSPPSPLLSPLPLPPPDDLDLNNPRWSAPRYQDHDDDDSSAGDANEVDGEDDDDEGLSEAEIVRKERGERWFALFVACLLSVGSHYGTHLLGPIKSRISREMGASNSQFSLLLAALSLNNTWTPLVGGLLTARLGTPLASIIATSFIFLGQAVILFFTGSDAGAGSLKGMLLGIWIFSLGVSPLAVVQETIIVRYFSHHGLGLSLALGLVVGKSSSFLSAISSYPLSEAFGRKGPFVVSTLLAGMSFGVNIVYCVFHYRTYRPPALDASSAPLDQDGLAAEKVVQRRRVRLANLQRLGDPFWLFILLNIFSGAIWSPFLNLAANLIQRRYLLSDSLSAKYASLLLAFSIVLYPLAGYAHDRYHSRSPFIVYRLFVLASCLTLSCFVWLVLPVGLMRTPVPAMISFGAGHGFATLLLVLVAPGLVEREWVSTALGAHKSMESAATTLTQTLSGILLDSNPKIHIPTFPQPPPSNSTASPLAPTHPHSPGDIPPDTPSTHLLLLIFLLLNIFQLATTVLLWRLAASRRTASLAATTSAPDPDDESALSASPEDGYAALPKQEEQEEETTDRSLLSPSSSQRPLGIRSEDGTDGPQSSRTSSSPSGSSIPLRKGIRTLSASSRRPLLDRRGSGRALASEESVGGALGDMPLSWDERIRGRWFFVASIAFVFLVWAVFGGVAVWRLEGG